MSDKMREAFESWAAENLTEIKNQRKWWAPPDGPKYKDDRLEFAWKAWQAAQRHGMEHAELDEPMTEDFKAAWRNGLPLDCMEAKWAFVGWREAQRQGGEAVSDTELAGLKQRAEAWLSICGLLDDIDPEWRKGVGTAKENALGTIMRLRTAPQPDVPEGWMLVRKEWHPIMDEVERRAGKMCGLEQDFSVMVDCDDYCALDEAERNNQRPEPPEDA